MAEPVRVEVGGVQATAGEIKDALVIFCLAASTNVKPPLTAAGHSARRPPTPPWPASRAASGITTATSRK